MDLPTIIIIASLAVSAVMVVAVRFLRVSRKHKLSIMFAALECLRDAIRLDVLHQPILNFRLHINRLDQPTNLDTMGDLLFSLLGSVFGTVLYLRETPAPQGASRSYTS